MWRATLLGAGAKAGHRGLRIGVGIAAGDPVGADAAVVGVGHGGITRADAVNHQIERAATQFDRQRCAQPIVGAGIGQHHAVAVDQVDANVEVGANRTGLDRECSGAGARHEHQPVRVIVAGHGAGMLHALGAARQSHLKPVRRVRAIACIVQTQGCAVVRHGGDVILGVVGARVLASAPLGDRLSVANAHDRCPAGRTRTVSPVVGV